MPSSSVCESAASSASALGGPGRWASTTSAGSASRRLANTPRKRSEASSAHWASSIASSSGRPVARFAHSQYRPCSVPKLASTSVAPLHYASWMSPPATLVMWFQLRSPELAEDFERLMAEDRDIVRGSLDAVSDWRLTRPADVPGQSIGQADYVLIAEIVEVERFEQQASEHVQRLEDDLAHLVSSRGMLVVRPVF
jgi:hypothetical protein